MHATPTPAPTPNAAPKPIAHVPPTNASAGLTDRINPDRLTPPAAVRVSADPVTHAPSHRAAPSSTANPVNPPRKDLSYSRAVSPEEPAQRWVCTPQFHTLSWPQCRRHVPPHVDRHPPTVSGASAPALSSRVHPPATATRRRYLTSCWGSRFQDSPASHWAADVVPLCPARACHLVVALWL